MTARPRHIVHLAKFYPPAAGGIERITQAYAQAAACAQTRVSVACFSQGQAEWHKPQPQLTILRCGPCSHSASLHLSASYARHARRLGHEADIVHLHEPNPFAALVALSLPRSVPLIVSWHADIVGRPWAWPMLQPLQKAVLRRAQRVLVLAQGLITHSHALAAYAHKCQVVPSGVALLNGTSASASRLYDSSSRDTGFILAVGRLVAYKGFDVLLRAVVGTGLRVVIVGDGPRRDTLQSLSHRLGVDRQVSFVGHVVDERLRQFYRECRFFVMPSTTSAEAFGLVQLEAMAAGKAVINTALLSGVPEVSLHGATGLTVRPTDAEDLRAAMLTLWHDPALCDAFGRAGAQRVSEHYSASALKRELGRAYGFSLDQTR